MLAEAIKLDGTFYDLAQPAIGSASALGGEDGQQLGIAFVTLSDVKEGANEALWRPLGRWGIYIHPERREDLGHVAFELPHLLCRDAAWMQSQCGRLTALVFMVLMVFRRRQFFL